MKNESQQHEQDIVDIVQGVEQQSPEERTAQQEREKAELRARWQNATASYEASSPSDQELLDRWRGQDAEAAKHAFRQLVRRYQRYVYTYMKGKLDEQTAFDMTCDVFAQAYTHVEQFPAESSLKTWLLSIARQKILHISRISEKTWYLRLFPLPLYQWYLNRTHAEEPLEDSMPADTCERVRRQLSAYIDNELAPSETDVLEAHLTTCLPCSEEYDRLLDTVDIARSAGLLPAPANLLPVINAALEQEAPFERLLASFRKLARGIPAPVFQVATLTLGVAVILLGLLNSSRQDYIYDLETRNARLQTTVRSLNRGSVQDAMLNTFVIFTRTIVSEAMPPEAARFADTLIPEPKKAPRPRAISGTVESVRLEIITYLNAIQATITENRIHHETLNVLKITTEVPRDSRFLLSLFLQHLELSEPDQGNDIMTTSIDIYIIGTYE